MDPRELENGMMERDALDNEVTALLNALPRVEAPGNFEFGVKARIAGRSSVKPSFAPFIRVAAPLMLLLVVGGFVIFYETLPNPERTTSQMSVVAPQPVVQDSQSRTETPQVETPSAPNRETLASVGPAPIVEKPVIAPRRGNTNPANRSRGGSIDLAQPSANVIMPPGFESANPRRGGNTATDVPVRNLLGILGISADFGKGGYEVRSVAENSMAARAGVKAKDIIKSIDGQTLKSDMTVKGDSGSKVFSILRDGKLITLKFGN